MDNIKLGDSGPGVEDVQSRLALIGYLDDSHINGTFDDATFDAVTRFSEDHNCSSSKYKGEVTPKVWAALVDATFNLGDRTLYLKMPYFHGHDVAELQHALGALGFFVGNEDGIFGAHTEEALRKFQLNLGLPSDGIAGAYTFSEIRNLEHSWVGKEAHHKVGPLGFARASDVLESNAICIFGTCDFTRSIASRMSNLALATNPSSKIVSAEALSVAPDDDMLFVNISVEADSDAIPTVIYSDDGNFSERLAGALDMARAAKPYRIKVVFPETTWMEAGEERSAQHFAITLLDALCMML